MYLAALANASKRTLAKFSASVKNMSLTPFEWQIILNFGFEDNLLRKLLFGVGFYTESQEKWPYCHRMMQSIARRVASKLMAKERNEAAKKAEELCASGQCAAAVVPLQYAIYLGDLPSCALKAWLHIDGREGVAKDRHAAFELAEEGARLDCPHCKGVMAYLNIDGWICDDRPQLLNFVHENSKYSQFVIANLYHFGAVGLRKDYAQAAAFYRLAAAQGLDGAQFNLACIYYFGAGVAQDIAEALRLFQLAAAQGYPEALYFVGIFYEHGYGVATDVVEAISWYMRAQAAGYPDADVKVLRLRHK